MTTTVLAASRQRRRLGRLAWLGVLALLAGCRRHAAVDQPMLSYGVGQLRRATVEAGEPMLPYGVGRLLRATVEAGVLPADLRQGAARLGNWRDLCRFYRARDYLPAWSDGRGPLPRANELLRAMDAAAGDGLDPHRYRRQELAGLIGAARAALARGPIGDPAVERRIVDLDIQCTYAYMAIAEHLTAGRLRPQTLPVAWYTRPRRIQADLLLQEALAGKIGLAPSLASLAPEAEGYRRLRQALAEYRVLAARGGWAQIPPGADLGPGVTGERVAALRARLAATGDLQPAAASAAAASSAAAPAAFGPDLAAAVARFRARHGLGEGQTVDAATLQELDVPVAERIRQLEINMERWRWLPGELGERYILVNIPDFRLQVIEDQRVALAMRVIVGKAHTKTPVFSDQMTYLVLNPEWNLPDSIVTQEVVPQLAAHPDYLQHKGLEVVKVRGTGDDDGFGAIQLDAAQIAELGRPGSPYRLRHPPGGDNPLGRIKFMFPNRFDVYLHDTPSGRLFARTERNFSHGCVRLENPLELAGYLLRDDPRWSPEAISERLASGRLTTIALPHPLPVHILYWTAWVDDDGTVQFRSDVYGLDETLAKALAAEPSVWVKLAAVRGETPAQRSKA